MTRLIVQKYIKPTVFLKQIQDHIYVHYFINKINIANEVHKHDDNIDLPQIKINLLQSGYKIINKLEKQCKIIGFKNE